MNIIMNTTTPAASRDGHEKWEGLVNTMAVDWKELVWFVAGTIGVHAGVLWTLAGALVLVDKYQLFQSAKIQKKVGAICKTAPQMYVSLNAASEVPAARRGALHEAGGSAALYRATSGSARVLLADEMEGSDL